MTGTAKTSLDPPGRPRDMRSPVAAAMRSHGWVMLGVSVVTIALELGVYVVARMRDVSQSSAAMATLAVCIAWVALAAPVLASGPSTALGGAVRGAVTADASAVTLLVLWLCADGNVTFVSGMQAYCTMAAVTLAAIAVVRCGRSAGIRSILAVSSSLILMVMLTTPLWIGGLLKASSASVRDTIVTSAVYANPFYSITAAVAEQTGFVWHLSSVMYDVTRIGSYSPAPQPPWYAAALIYLCATVAAAGICLLTARRGRQESA